MLLVILYTFMYVITKVAVTQMCFLTGITDPSRLHLPSNAVLSLFLISFDIAIQKVQHFSSVTQKGTVHMAFSNNSFITS